MSGGPIRNWLTRVQHDLPRLHLESPDRDRNHLTQTPASSVEAEDTNNPIVRYRDGSASQLKRIGIRLDWALQDFNGTIRNLLSQERDLGAVFNITPIVIGLGIATYFTANSEPVFAVVLFSLLAAASIAILIKSRGTAHLLAVFIALFLLGMTVAQVRTNIVSGPVIARQITGEMTGIVLARDFNSRGNPRYVVKPYQIEGLTENALPR
ncbi:MAG: hypothetical protein ACR2O0_08540 [Rhizobiaceae bacterium]